MKIDELIEGKLKELLEERSDTLAADNGVVRMVITGGCGCEKVINCSGSQISVSEKLSDNPTLTLSIADSDFVDMMNGNLNPKIAFLDGKLEIKGDVGLAFRIMSCFEK